MSNDWWSRKMASPQARPAPPAYPPTAPTPRPVLPPVPPVTARSAPSVAVTAENIAEVAGYWKGGVGTRTETEPCPQCGSDLFFHRADTGSKPRCYSCGYTQGRPMQGMPPS